MTFVSKIVLAALVAGIAGPARAANCPAADAFAVPSGGLPATAAAVRQKALTVLALGGAATLGQSAKGAAFTYPARLAEKLGAALPGVTVRVAVSAVPRQSPAGLRAALTAALATDKPALVIWGPGASEAGRGESLDAFDDFVAETVATIQAAGADLVLMTLQYAPRASLVVPLSPYRSAVLRAADSAGAPVLDRYELMKSWHETGFLDLDATDPDERVKTARGLFDCMADILAEGIAGAVR